MLDLSQKQIILLLGGARSGKSRLAQESGRRAESVLFVATAEAGDEDMRLRILKHQQERPPGWHLLEATSRIGERIREVYRKEQLIIIDCITLLATNLVCRVPESEYNTLELDDLEQSVNAEINDLLQCLRDLPASSIIVSNEVGLGIVPEYRISRLYRDLLGRANQLLAAASDKVYLLVAGLPLKIKG